MTSPETVPMCEVITSSEYKNQTLDLLVDEERAGSFQRLPSPRKVSIASPIVSIKDLLDQQCFNDSYSSDDNRYFLNADKSELSLNLALSLLQLSDRDWRQVEWSSETIFFLRDPSSGMLQEKTKPYLSWRLREVSKEGGTPDRDRTLCDPQLLDFARLLLEIHVGKSLPDEALESPYILRKKVAGYTKRLLASYQDKLREAIRACISTAGKDAAAQPERMREFIFRKVVLNLEAYRMGFTEPLPQTPDSVVHDPFRTAAALPSADAELSLYDVSTSYRKPENDA